MSNNNNNDNYNMHLHMDNASYILSIILKMQKLLNGKYVFFFIKCRVHIKFFIIFLFVFIKSRAHQVTNFFF